MTRDISDAMKDHTFVEELELNGARERAVGAVAWNIRSERRTRLKGNCEILICNIRRQIGDVQQGVVNIRVGLWTIGFLQRGRGISRSHL